MSSGKATASDKSNKRINSRSNSITRQQQDSDTSDSESSKDPSQRRKGSKASIIKPPDPPTGHPVIPTVMVPVPRSSLEDLSSDTPLVYSNSSTMSTTSSSTTSTTHSTSSDTDTINQSNEEMKQRVQDLQVQMSQMFTMMQQMMLAQSSNTSTNVHVPLTPASIPVPVSTSVPIPTPSSTQTIHYYANAKGGEQSPNDMYKGGVNVTDDDDEYKDVPGTHRPTVKPEFKPYESKYYQSVGPLMNNGNATVTFNTNSAGLSTSTGSSDPLGYQQSAIVKDPRSACKIPSTTPPTLTKEHYYTGDHSFRKYMDNIETLLTMHHLQEYLTVPSEILWKQMVSRVGNISNGSELYTYYRNTHESLSALIQQSFNKKLDAAGFKSIHRDIEVQFKQENGTKWVDDKYENYNNVSNYGGKFYQMNANLLWTYLLDRYLVIEESNPTARINKQQQLMAMRWHVNQPAQSYDTKFWSMASELNDLFRTVNSTGDAFNQDILLGWYLQSLPSQLDEFKKSISTSNDPITRSTILKRMIVENYEYHNKKGTVNSSEAVEGQTHAHASVTQVPATTGGNSNTKKKNKQRSQPLRRDRPQYNNSNEGRPPTEQQSSNSTDKSINDVRLTFFGLLESNEVDTNSDTTSSDTDESGEEVDTTGVTALNANFVKHKPAEALFDDSDRSLTKGIFIADTACNQHVLCNESLFVKGSIKKLATPVTVTGLTGISNATMMGSVDIDGHTTLTNVLLVKSCPYNLVSIRQLCNHPHISVAVTDKHVTVYYRNKTHWTFGKTTSGLWGYRLLAYRQNIPVSKDQFYNRDEQSIQKQKKRNDLRGHAGLSNKTGDATGGVTNTTSESKSTDKSHRKIPKKVAIGNTGGAATTTSTAAKPITANLSVADTTGSAQHGFLCLTSNDTVLISQNEHDLISDYTDHGIYGMKATTSNSTIHEQALAIHYRNNHVNLNPTTLIKMGVPIQIAHHQLKISDCDTCSRTKVVRSRTGGGKYLKPTTPFQRLDCDLIGPISVTDASTGRKQVITTTGGMKYVLTITDHFSRYRFTHTIARKSDAADCIIQTIKNIQTQHNAVVRYIHSDHGGEFTSKSFEQYLRSQGIDHTTTPTDKPSLNGMAEATNKKLIGIVRSMITHSNAHYSLFGEAFMYATYLLNRLPMKSRNYQTAFSIVHGEEHRDQHKMVQFGINCWYRNTTNTGDKLNTTVKGSIVGYDTSRLGFRVLLPNGKVCITRDLNLQPARFNHLKELGFGGAQHDDGTVSDEVIDINVNDVQMFTGPDINVDDEYDMIQYTPQWIQPSLHNGNTVRTSSTTTSNRYEILSSDDDEDSVTDVIDLTDSTDDIVTHNHDDTDIFELNDDDFTEDIYKYEPELSMVQEEASDIDEHSFTHSDLELEFSDIEEQKYASDTSKESSDSFTTRTVVPTSASTSSTVNYEIGGDLDPEYAKELHDELDAAERYYGNVSVMNTNDKNDIIIVTTVSTTATTVIGDTDDDEMESMDAYSYHNQIRTLLDGTLNEMSLSFISSIIHENEPLSHVQALKSRNWPKWQEAEEKEFDSLHKKGVFQLVERTSDMKLIPSRGVYKVKLKSDGTIDKYKFRLVVKGFHQEYGIEFFDTYAPVARFKCIRTVLALAAQFNMELRQLDFRTAFLNAGLEEDIYISIPTGDTLNDKINKNKYCYKLDKALYGLKQAPRNWNLLIDSELVTLGYTATDADPCIYYKYVDGSDVPIILCVYVDDVITAVRAQDEHVWEHDKKQLALKYELDDIGELNWCLQMKVTRDRTAGTITLSQEQYVKEILEQYNCAKLKPVKSPCKPSVDLTTPTVQYSDKKRPPVLLDANGKHMYQSILGKLMYLANTTRVDIAYTVHLLARYSSAPYTHHFDAAIHVLQYLVYRPDYCLTFRPHVDPNVMLELDSFTDSDYAGDKNSRQSTSGYIVQLNGNVISWSSQKQKVVAQSTTEAEFIAANSLARDLIWFSMLLNDIFGVHLTPTMNIDNEAAQYWINNEKEHHSKQKHIDTKYKLVKQWVQEVLLQVKKVHTDLNIADILTKSVDQKTFDRLVPMIYNGTNSSNNDTTKEKGNTSE